MKKIMDQLNRTVLHFYSGGFQLKAQKGQALSEYAIILGVIALVIIGTLVLFRDALVGVFTKIVNGLKGV